MTSRSAGPRTASSGWSTGRSPSPSRPKRSRADMQRLFGLPMGAVATTMAIALGLLVAGVVALGVRHREPLRMGLRNVMRRPGRAALIVVGLMLGTTIIGSALATGDTMSRTVRGSVLQTLGETDELISVRTGELSPQLEDVATRVEYFDADKSPAIERAL